MAINLEPVISQVTYSGVGDIDECWIIATYWAMRQAGYNGHLPSIREFRAAAGVPDVQGKPNGGTVWQINRGLDKTLPNVKHTLVDGWAWKKFIDAVKSGNVASVALLSAKLPVRYRFGFNGWHQCGIVWDGTSLYISNPLAKDDSKPLPISEGVLLQAMSASALAVLFPVKPKTTPKPKPTPTTPKPKVPRYKCTVRAGTLIEYRVKNSKIVARVDHRTGSFSAVCSKPFFLKTTIPWRNNGRITLRRSGATCVLIKSGPRRGTWIAAWIAASDNVNVIKLV